MIKRQDQLLEMEDGDKNEKLKRHKIKVNVHRQLIEALDLNEAQRIPLEQLHEECSRKIDTLLSGQQYPLSGPEKQQLLADVPDEVFGDGPTGVMLREPTVRHILGNGPHLNHTTRDTHGTCKSEKS